MKKITKILWISVISYIIIMFFLAFANINSTLPELMTENIGNILFGVIIIQLIIYIINKFTKE